VQTNGLVTHFVAGSSTGGTMTGTARYLKSVNPDIKTLLADPEGSVLYDGFVNEDQAQLKVGSWEIEGVGKDSIPGVMSWDVVDGAMKVDDASAFSTCRKVASKLGVLIGGSSGLNLHAASVLSGKIDSGVIVTVLPDSGYKYLSKIYNNEWLEQKGLLDQEKKVEQDSIYWKQRDPMFDSKVKDIEKLVDTPYSAPNQDRPPADNKKLSSKKQTDTEIQFLEDTAAQMVEYYRQSIEIGGKPVVVSNTPESIRAVFQDAGVPMEFEHEEPSWDQKHLRDAVSTVLQTSVRSSSPLFLNQLYAGVDPVALAGEWVSATLNTNVHTFEVAPALTEIEKSCLAKVTRVWQKTKNNEETPSHDGLFVPGGSISILYSLLLARHQYDTSIRKTGLRAESNLVAFCSDMAHYSYKKSAIVSGLGENNLIAVKSLPNGAMDPQDLKAKLEQAIEDGKNPFYVGLTAGTTVLGAYDPYHEIMDVIDSFSNHNIWTHIDGAWGGGAMLSKKHGHLMNGAERSDSFSWNPHKMLGIPLQCSVFVTKHQGVLSQTVGTKAEYLFQPDKNNAGADLGDRTLQCGRKADALKLWLAWKMRGDDGFVECVDRSFALAKFVEKEVENSNDRFVLVQPAQCSNVCFWYVPPRLRPFNRKTATEEDWAELSLVAPKIKDAMQKAGDAMIGFQPIKSMGYVNFFRLVLPNPRHLTESDLRSMMDRMDMFGRGL
jgi:glutamate/tyrosine decarboxylase-like PLP-dependent enzyme